MPFADFAVLAGTGADFTDVGAIEIFINGSGAPGLDASLANLQSLKSTPYSTVAPASVPLTLGGEIFVDNGGGTNALEQNNGLRDSGTEPFFISTAGNEIIVQLFDADPTVGNPSPIATTTVASVSEAAPGTYQFDTAGGNPIGPGTFFVVIPKVNSTRPDRSTDSSEAKSTRPTVSPTTMRTMTTMVCLSPVSDSSAEPSR